MIKRLSGLTISVFFVASLQADYNWSVSGNVSRLENPIEMDADAYGIAVMKCVDPLAFSASRPFDETAFIDRIGHYGFAYGTVDFSGFPNGSRDSDFWALEYVFRKENSRHGFSLVYQQTENDLRISIPDIAYGDESESDRIGLGYAFYIQKDWTVELLASTSNQDGSITLEADSDSSLQSVDGDSKTYALNTRRLLALGKNQWIVLKGGIAYADTELETRLVSNTLPRFLALPSREVLSRQERSAILTAGFERMIESEEWSYSFEAIYYPTVKTGIGLEYDQPESGDISNVELSLSHYFSEAFSIDANFGRTFIDFPGVPDADSYGIEGTFRF